MNTAKSLLAAALCAAMSLPAVAQSEVANTNEPEGTPEKPWHITLKADARMDYDYQWEKAGELNMGNPLEPASNEPDHTSGFHGRYLNFILDAQINRHFGVHWRQRLNRFQHIANDVLSATDWIYLDWKPNDNWTFAAGKQVVAVGGYEYDRNPINVFFASMYWNNFACYQFGVTATRHFGEGRHSLTAQVTNSPYQMPGKNCYAYNLMWTGTLGFFQSLWSVNMFEYERGKYINFISLGNRFNFNKLYVELDYMNRYTGKQQFLFGDFSLIGKTCVNIDHVDLFVKGGYEKFCLNPGDERTIDKPFYGGGIEYYPLKRSRDLRLHLVADVTHDASRAGVALNTVSAGVTWRITLLNR